MNDVNGPVQYWIYACIKLQANNGLFRRWMNANYYSVFYVLHGYSPRESMIVSSYGYALVL